MDHFVSGRCESEHLVDGGHDVRFGTVLAVDTPANAGTFVCPPVGFTELEAFILGVAVVVSVRVFRWRIDLRLGSFGLLAGSRLPLWLGLGASFLL